VTTSLVFADGLATSTDCISYANGLWKMSSCDGFTWSMLMILVPGLGLMPSQKENWSLCAAS
jgi:hypothetical protein